MTEAFLGGGAIQLQGELRGKQRRQSHGQSHGAALAGGKSTGIMLSLKEVSLKERASETPSGSSPAPASRCAEFSQCLQTAVTSFWTG